MNTPQSLPQKQSVLPEEFLLRLQQLLTPEQRASVLRAFAQPRHTTLRANTLKISASELKNTLEKSGILLESVPWAEIAFFVKDVQVRQIFSPLYTDGALYVQGFSSMLPPLILDPRPEERVLDLTAAPGSKTTQMAAMMRNTGEIVANDLSPVRLFKLQANLKLQGVTNTKVARCPGQYFWRRYPEYFDRTLVDVPCTMEGRFSEEDPDTFADWSLKKIKELSARQKHLLRSAVTATQPGGVIVYSTCTLAPEENEAVVDWLLEKENGAVELEEIALSGLEMLPGITEWQGKKFRPELTKTRRILPSSLMEGFFVAKLRKIRSNIPEDRGENEFRSRQNYRRLRQEKARKRR
jgi:16S rRNA (cytosine1407-C5)-methyltransferase